MLALVILNALGIRGLNDLPVSAFAISPQVKGQFTDGYTFALAMNFRPNNDYRTDITKAASPMEVLVGADDDQFLAEHFVDEFKASPTPIRVTILDNISHINLTTSETAIRAAVASVGRMNGVVS